MASASNSTTNLSKRSEFHIGNKYTLVRKIGSGSFGDIYLGINKATGEVCFYFDLCFFNIESHISSRIENTECGVSSLNITLFRTRIDSTQDTFIYLYYMLFCTTNQSVSDTYTYHQ